jgi:HD-like signal output (HDOD) protein
METAFTAGLLHDVGKVLLAMTMQGKQERVDAESASDPEITRLEVEREILGTTHAEIGYLLGEHWLLPSVVTTAIRYHHSPELDRESRIITNIVFLANLYCEASQFADSIVFDEPVLESLGILEISEDSFRKTLKNYTEVASEIPPLV